MINLLIKIAEEHPEQAIGLLQSVLDILKANPELLKDVVAQFHKS